MQKHNTCVKKAVKLGERFIINAAINNWTCTWWITGYHTLNDSVSEVRFIPGKAGLIKGHALLAKGKCRRLKHSSAPCQPQRGNADILTHLLWVLSIFI